MPKGTDDSENVFDNGQAKSIARLSSKFLIERIQGKYGAEDPEGWANILKTLATQGKETLVILSVYDLQYGPNEAVPKELWNDEAKPQ